MSATVTVKECVIIIARLLPTTDEAALGLHHWADITTHRGSAISALVICIQSHVVCWNIDCPGALRLRVCICLSSVKKKTRYSGLPWCCLITRGTILYGLSPFIVYTWFFCSAMVLFSFLTYPWLYQKWWGVACHTVFVHGRSKY
jgi:hypothetical protein